MPRQTASPAEIVDVVAYSHYRYNRKHFPAPLETVKEDWYPMYGKKMVDRMERKYQEERHANVDPVFRTIIKEVSSDT